MAASPQPFPNVPGSGQGSPAPSSSSQLVGSAAGARPLSPTPDQIVSGYMDQIRSLHVTIDALAQQFPAAAQDLQIAKTSLVNSMAKVVSSVNQPEQSPTTPTF